MRGGVSRGSEAPGASEVLDRRLDPDGGAPIAVAFSGGADSLLTLLATKAWADRHGRQILVLTVDHRLQAAGADWTRACAGVAEGLGLSFRALAWDGPKPATGLPAAARQARHRLLAEAVREAGSSVLVLGHTASDIAESEVMRADGTNIGALREWSPSPAWPEGRGVFCLRPLLALTRDEVRARLAADGWSWIDDPANEDQRFGRSRARASLQQPGHPREGGDAGLSRTQARVASAGRSQIAGTCTSAKTLGPRFRGDDRSLGVIGRMVFAADGSITLPREAAFARLLQVALLCVSGGETPARTAKVEALAARLAGPSPFTATLGGCRVSADAREIVIMRDAGEIRRGRMQPLDLPSEGVVVWDGRFELTPAGPGLSVCPLQGLAARLPDAERARLCAIPAAARPALPAIVVNGTQTVTCPILAEGSQVRGHALAAARMLAACDLIAHERAVQRLAHGGFTSDVLSWAREMEKRST